MGNSVKTVPSIRKKILFYLLSFSGLLLLLLWLFQVVFLDSFYKSIKVSQIKKAASTIETNLNQEDIEDLVINLSEYNEICTEIVSVDGVVRYGYETGRNCIIHRMPISEKLALFTRTINENNQMLIYIDGENNRPSGSLYSYSNLGGGNISSEMEAMPMTPAFGKSLPDSMIYTKAVTTKNGETYLILMNSNINPVDATVDTLRIQLYWITGVMLVLSIILAIVISKRVSKPIENLNEGAKKLAKGNYQAEFDGKGYCEIQELSDTLNIAAKELSKVDNLRKELIANVSHDLRTPLTLITGYAEAMRDLPDELSRENAQVIVNEGKRLTSLVNDLLEISKLERGSVPIQFKSFNLTGKTEEIVTAMRELLKSEGYKLEFNYDQEIIVNSDEIRIMQAFYNLLINAVNYAGENKTITINQELYKVGKEIWVKLKIYDTGVGIKEEDAPYIWDRYYKGEKYHQRAITGSGLGLSIVKNTMEQLEGKYGFEMQEVGSMFYISLRVN